MPPTSEILDGIVEQDLKGNISVKPTQVGLEIGKEFFKENLRLIMDRAKEHDIFIRWDMESSEWTQATLDPFEELWAEGYRNMGTVLQSYLRRTMDDALRMNELGARVRLCKGAYAEPPEVAFQDKGKVDQNYVDVAKALLTDGNYPALATHDDEIIDTLLEFVREGRDPRRPLRVPDAPRGSQGSAAGSAGGRVSTSGCTSPSANRGTPTSCVAWPSARRTCSSSPEA